MIYDFACNCAKDIYQGVNSKNARILPKHLHENAQDKLDMIHAARQLNDLLIPPGNRLEALKGNLRGWHSIRINDQWRIIFQWFEGNAYKVKIIDYH